MLSNDNIKDILKATRGKHADIGEQDVAFLVLCDAIEDMSTAYEWAYGTTCSKDIFKFANSARMKDLAEVMKSFGIGAKDSLTLSSEENMSAMVQTLNDIRTLRQGGTIDPDLIKLEADIRFKIQSKFELDQNKNEAKHLIVVPQKHDMICPHTNRECTKMPSEEACCKFYGLKKAK